MDCTALIVMAVSTYMVFCGEIKTDIILKHLLSFAAISAGAYLYTHSMQAFITAFLLFMSAGIYYTFSELMGIVSKVKL